MSIVAQKITYIHPDNQVLFKGIDLTINKGQKVALVGNNGCLLYTSDAADE